MTYSELQSKALENPAVKADYDAPEPEFSLLRQMLKARQDQDLSQAEVAQRMGTKAPAVTRLETSLSTGKHLPYLGTLRKYAETMDNIATAC